MATIDFSGVERQVTDSDTSTTATTVTLHEGASALYAYATQAGTYKYDAGDDAVILPASVWIKVWDRSPDLACSRTVLFTLDSSGDLYLRQV